jgi:L-fuculokinase
MEQVTAVLDIGKTNKKIALYNSSMKLVHISTQSFPSLPFEDVRVEQVEAIESWFLGSLKNLSQAYSITSISITTHGAGVVCVGENGLPSVPVIDYTTEVDDSVHQRFFELAGEKNSLQEKTCTAELKPLINVGKLIFFAKERFPDEFEKTRKILLYPQYFSMRLTGVYCADYTYLGCHTYLWNHKENRWSFLVDRLGIRSLLPEKIDYPGTIAGTVTAEVAEKTGLSPDTPVLFGVHDSNSSLVPYLLSGDDDFLLNSTGTWCVAMHPVEKPELNPEDLGKTVFINLSVRNSPVKTAVFMGGLEFETWFTLLQRINQRDDYPEFSEERTQAIIDKASDFILPGVVQGAGQYPDSIARVVSRGESFLLDDIVSGSRIPELFHRYEEAFTVLLISLALHTVVAFERVGLGEHMPVYTEGGFRQNRGYNKILAALLKNNECFTTGIDEATSFGAALLSWAAVSKKPLQELSHLSVFSKRRVEPASLSGLERYSESFFRLLSNFSGL